MKRVALLAAAAFLLLGAFRLVAQQRTATPARQLMREKLTHAQQLLEAIVLQDFDAIEFHAGALNAISSDPAWPARPTPVYRELAGRFRTSTRRMLQAANGEGIDLVAVAYNKMSFSCVDCHRHIRAEKRAVQELPTLSERMEMSGLDSELKE